MPTPPSDAARPTPAELAALVGARDSVAGVQPWEAPEPQMRPHDVPYDLRRARQATVCAYVVGAPIVVWAALALPPSLYALGAALLLLTLVAMRKEIHIGRVCMAPDEAVIYLGALINPALGVLCAATLVGAPRGYPPLFRAVNWLTYMLAALIGGFAVRVVAGMELATEFAAMVAGAFAVTIAGGLSLFALQVALYALASRRIDREDRRGFAFGVLVSIVMLAPLYIIGSVLIDQGGYASLAILILPAALLWHLYSAYGERNNMRLAMVRVNSKITRGNLQFAAAMIRALDARDSYTANHSAAVAAYSRDIARAVGMNDRHVRAAHLAGLLHDIGKIGVPEAVLNKQGKLTADEYEQMKSHAEIGAGILSEVDSYVDYAAVVRHHHERIDGKGYPHGLAGAHIPALSRIIAVADTYSAMTTDRPYREGLNPLIAIEELQRGAGGQLDREYAEAFVAILEQSSDAYRRGRSMSFDVEVAKHQALGDFARAAITNDRPDEPELNPIAV